MTHDRVDELIDRAQRSRLLVIDRDLEFFFDAENDVQCVERIEPEVFERSAPIVERILGQRLLFMQNRADFFRDFTAIHPGSI